jgi:hypothetical protein
MAKLAKKEENTFSPIAQKLIDAVSRPAQIPSAGLMTDEGSEEPDLQLTSTRTNIDTDKISQQHTEIAERLTRQMRYGATPTEEKETKEFVSRISAATGLSLTHSNLMRSCRDLLFQVEDKLIDEIRNANLKRPINDKHAIARFEAHITEIIRTAIRREPIPFNGVIYDHHGQDT